MTRSSAWGKFDLKVKRDLAQVMVANFQPLTFRSLSTRRLLGFMESPDLEVLVEWESGLLVFLK